VTGALLTTLAHAAPLAGWSFNGSDEGFVHGGSPDLWEWGTPSADPGACFDGACWCTGLDSDYGTDSLDTLTFASYDLTGIEDPHLTMVHWYDIDSSTGGDYGQLQYDDGSGNWTALPPTLGGGDVFTGTTTGWRTVYFDLSGLTDLSRVRAVLVSDDTINRPGWCIDQVQVWDGDIVPPVIEPTLWPVDTQDVDGPYELTATVVDDDAVADVSVHWFDGVEEHEAPMVESPADSWLFDFPIVEPGTTVEWWITAEDETGNLTRWPDADMASFRVYLAAPTNLQTPEGRLVGNSVHMHWDEPDSPTHDVLAYRLYRDGMALFPDIKGTSTIAEMPDSEAVFAVSAIYATTIGELEGDRSEPLTVSVSLPTIDPLVPGSGWPGDTLRIELTGSYLQLVDGDVTLDLGDGITVSPASVTDVDRATFEIAIADDAEAGPRIATLRSGEVEVEAAAAFEILDGVPPSLTSVEPDSLRQGSHGSVVVTLDHLPAGTPVVDLGEGVVVESTAVDGPAVTVEVTVLADAPLGERPIVVDDGERILEGLEFTVRDQAVRADKNCATGPGAGIVSILAALALTVARRSRNQR
jgi:hypothetical protein